VMIDLMGPLLQQMALQGSAEPLGQAGLYRKLRKDYFDRVEAIDFAVSHDDGNGSVDISRADVVILGVSRCGKTPLSMYLAVHGWKVAKHSDRQGHSAAGRALPDRSAPGGRLNIEPGRLLEHRRKREERMAWARSA